MIHLLLQNGAQPKVPRYWPAVKFQQISKDTIEKLRTIKSDDSNGENANDEDETDPSDDGNPNSADTTNSTPTPCAEFLIDSDIDINSTALLDMISEEEVVGVTPEIPLNTQTTAPSRPMTVDEALAMWD